MYFNTPALVAQSDAVLNGDQEVAGSIPGGSANNLWNRLIMKYFLVILSLPLIQERQFLTSEYAQILVNHLKE